MALRDWIKNEPGGAANANSANPANYGEAEGAKLAKFARLALASPTKRKMDLLPVDYYDTEIDAVINEFDNAGVSVHTVTAEIRQRAREIMAEFESAAFMDDRELFDKKLKEWRDTWLSRCH
jgi:hypothetical protein